MRLRSILLLLVALTLVTAGAALADDDDGRFDVRTAGTCTSGASSRLRLVGRDGRIQIRFELGEARRTARWTLVITHERRLVAHAVVRTTASGSLELRRYVPDYDGADLVVVRGTGPRGESCWARLTGSAARNSSG